MAQDCLKILHKKPNFNRLVTQSACLNWRANLKASLGYESSSSQTGQSAAAAHRQIRGTTEEDIASEMTRETRNSAMSTDFGQLSLSGSS